MNMFVLDFNPAIAARMHCDKHVGKMIVETAQLLSTAHRILDGAQTWIVPMLPPRGKRGYRKKHWKLCGNSLLENRLYKVSHQNHPCALWVRETTHNYKWAYHLFVNLCNEFRLRRGYDHLTDTKLRHVLGILPKNIVDGGLTRHALTMPDKYKEDCVVTSYRNFYIGEKDFANWDWINNTPYWWPEEKRKSTNDISLSMFEV